MRMDFPKSFVVRNSWQRFFSSAASGVFLILAGRDLTTQEFSQFQVAISVSALAYIAADFGLLGMGYIHASSGNIRGFSSCWTMRKFSILILLIVLLILGLSNMISLAKFFLILVCLQESILDSHLPIRQELFPKQRNSLAILTRRSLQVLLFISLSNFSSISSLMTLCISLGAPTSIFLFYDVIIFGKYLGRFQLSEIRDTPKYFFQSLGTSLMSFDNLIINHFGLIDLFYPYALGKKFYSTLMIPASTLIPQTIKNIKVSGLSFGNFLKTIRSTLLLTSLLATFSILIVFFLEFTFFDINHGLYEKLLVSTLVILALMGSITTNLNATSIYLRNFRIAIFASYLSSISYLVFLTLGFKFYDNSFVVLMVGLTINLVLEASIYLLFLFRVKKLH